jgi:hypothetical protein
MQKGISVPFLLWNKTDELFKSFARKKRGYVCLDKCKRDSTKIFGLRMRDASAGKTQKLASSRMKKG